MARSSRKNNGSMHIGLIPDGNRRYALKHGVPVFEGHRLGAKRIEDFIEWCDDYPQIKAISIFALSTENLNRPEEEVKLLWKVYSNELQKLLKNERIKRKKMKVRVIGDHGMWKADVKDIAKELYRSTKTYSRFVLNIMLAYGSKFELNEAVKQVIRKPFTRLDKALMVKRPLDLVIRTGNQHRLSNFMLYQASYAEIYFSEKMWPGFTRKDFDEVMEWYAEQKRKFGE